MANIFNLSNDRTPDVDRNTFDLSFQNNLTAKYGYLYPIFCKEVLPGDSFKIRPTFALEAMPMVFPVQTRQRVNLHFYYCRNRPAYEDFMSWIGHTKDDADPPFIDFDGNYDMLATGSIGDHLGLPTTLVGNYGTSNQLLAPFGNYALCSLSNTDIEYPVVGSTGVSQAVCFSFAEYVAGRENSSFVLSRMDIPTTVMLVANPNYVDYAGVPYRVSAKVVICDERNTILDQTDYQFLGTFQWAKYPTSTSENFALKIPMNDFVYDDMTVALNGTDNVRCYFVFMFQTANVSPVDWAQIAGLWSSFTDPVDHKDGFIAYGRAYNEGNYVSDITPNTSPFYDSRVNPNGLKISALPFRHYEAIYNTFYRDSRNNPLMVNGKPEYNKVYLNTAGGADSTHYELRRRNWESDFLTTAVQSPQQGAAPLVGVTSTGKMTFQDESGKQYQAQAEFADDGETITGFRVLSDDMPQGNLRSLIDMASTGISIADLRQVNSLQRWLEANMRKGLRYKDQMQAHYGINISYDELGMPEFIGGVSEDIRVNMVTQTTPTKGTGANDPARPLGSYAGQASCVGTSNHEIDKYCDEHGYIIGILSITPVPNYSQLLPKHFLKRNILDYYFPEFGNLGFVPIKCNEVCPVQTKAAGDDLNGVFGYQRAWYDYLASVDEVHGEFRKSLRDYLINRVFDVKPELSESFLLVDPKQLNEVFAVAVKNDDKFLGQVYFDCKVKRPIPLFGIPRIE